MFLSAKRTEHRLTDVRQENVRRGSCPEPRRPEPCLDQAPHPPAHASLSLTWESCSRRPVPGRNLTVCPLLRLPGPACHSGLSDQSCPIWETETPICTRKLPASI